MTFFKDLKKRSDVRWLSAAHQIGKLLNGYLRPLEAGSQEQGLQRCVDLIAASVLSPVAYAIAMKSERLAQCGVALRIVLADTSHASELQAIGTAFKATALPPQFRVVTDAALLDANEQLILGEDLSWSGDTLRRAERSNAQAVITRGAEKGVRAGRQAFEALWSTATPLEKIARRPQAGTFEPGQEIDMGAVLQGPLRLFREDGGKLHLVH